MLARKLVPSKNETPDCTMAARGRFVGIARCRDVVWLAIDLPTTPECHITLWQPPFLLLAATGTAHADDAPE